MVRKLCVAGWVIAGAVSTVTPTASAAQARPDTAKKAPAPARFHATPPLETAFGWKPIRLKGLENPLRQNPDSFEAYRRLGQEVYYRNCVGCHGARLDGQGPMAHGFNTPPVSFEDPGLLPAHPESFLFWRIAKGNTGLPKEAVPWNSSMPIWEDVLTERQIWAVILFLYDQTGTRPGTWFWTDDMLKQAGHVHVH